MPDPNADLLSAFDGHDVDGICTALEAGADPSQPIDGKLATEWLLEEYHRTERLPECLRLLLDHGGSLPDSVLEPVLLDDAEAVQEAIHDNPGLLIHRTTLRSAFTSLTNVSLLHVAAEYGNLNAARALIAMGADIDARAGVDAHGLGGHTPLFHTVNSNGNRSAPIMQLLVKSGANCEVFVKGLHWGAGYEWETLFFDVTPISFAQMGLMPQVHRSEQHIYENIRFLLEAAGRPVPPLENVPNRYLRK